MLLLLLLLLLLPVLYKLGDWAYRRGRLPASAAQHVLITGCDSGFGRALARRLDHLGVTVFAGVLSEAAGEELRAEASARLVPVLLDVGCPESVQAAVRAVTDRLPRGGGLWGVVNNAGIRGLNGPPEWLTLADFRLALKVNTLGVVDVSLAFLPLLKAGGGGRLVNMASMLGRLALDIAAPYCLSKAAVESFSDAMRRHLRGCGVGVSIIEPGYFRTPLNDVQENASDLHRLFQRCPEHVKEEYGEDFPDKLVEAVILGSIQEMMSDRLEDVVDAYQHALFARRPRDRYVVGTDARLLTTLQLLPSWLSDWILELLGRRNPKPRAWARA